MIKASVVLTTVILVSAQLFAQQPHEEKVVVTAAAYPIPFDDLSRSVVVLTREDIQKLPALSTADVLSSAAAVDLHSRSPFGIQTDLSSRGSTYAQVLVLVDGMRINDSQTGHHNGDFPVQLQDIERIEILLGAGSSIYGADAFGGIINIITKRDHERAHASLSAGQDGYFDASASAGFRKSNIEQVISASGNRSSGFEYDRDFRSVAASSRTRIGKRTSIFLSHVNKEFGANGFYGLSPSREWTNQTIAAIEHKREWKSGNSAEFQAAYRTHGDHFVYDQRTPELFASSHRTHSADFSLKYKILFSKSSSIILGGEAGGDAIHSTTLGDHAFGRASGFAELQQTFGKAAIYPGLRLDYYSNFGTALNPSISGNWRPTAHVRLRSSVGRAFRIPTFTELYYHDPSNLGNASLKPENAWSAEAGADFFDIKKWRGTITLFSRNERNVIDWIRATIKDQWRAENIGRVHVKGAELGIERSLREIMSVSAQYSRISADAGQVDYLSKYALDYARDSWSGSVHLKLPLGLEYSQTFNYKRRADGRDYFLLDNRLKRSFRYFSAAVEFKNLLNTQYQEVVGVDMPGRWFAVTISTK